MRALRGLLLFTVVEVVTLIAWLVQAGVPFNPSAKSVSAVVILAVGLFLEHYASVNVGSGRKPFGPLPSDKK